MLRRIRQTGTAPIREAVPVVANIDMRPIGRMDLAARKRLYKVDFDSALTSRFTLVIRP